MLSPETVQSLIAPYGARVSVDKLVLELNRLYHSFEAKDYDRIHPEVHDQLPPLWTEMINTVRSGSDDRAWDVLDFGCGTGFEAIQIIEKLGPDRIRSLTCYDPSPEMLAICRHKVASRLQHVRYCETLAEVTAGSRRYDLLTTNSLLHHLPAVREQVDHLDSVINPNAWWLMGHEPSRRFYTNPECSKALSVCNREARWKKLASPAACYRSLQRHLSIGDAPAEAAAQAAVRSGLFERRPRASVVARLVDFNVPHSNQEALDGRGFDFEQMSAELNGLWQLQWVKTYAFMGSFGRDRLSKRWRSRADHLARKYPLDGANFCSVWRHA